MRIVLDLQPLQTAGRFRGIGRYALSHAREFIRQNGDSEIFVLINDANSGSLDYVSGELSGLLPPGNLLVCPFPAFLFDDEVAWMRCCYGGLVEALEILREAFISRLRPDFVLVYSHMEFVGMATSVKRILDVPVGVVVYDFIPYYYDNFSEWPLSGKYAKKLGRRRPPSRSSSPTLSGKYAKKLEELKRADLLFCISEYVCNDAKKVLKRDAGVFSVRTGKSDFWRPLRPSEEDRASFAEKYGVRGPFILYSGGVNDRKNVKRLIEAYSKLDEGLRGRYSLLIVCGRHEGRHEEERKRLEKYASSLDFGTGAVLFAGYIPDEDLRMAYSLCSLFVFPSLSEGFGLTPLEAMSCGAPAIASDRTSVPEVMGMERALFDPESVEGIRDKIGEALSDSGFYGELKANARAQSGKFSWEITVERTWSLVNDFFSKRPPKPCAPLSEEEVIDAVVESLSGASVDDAFLREMSQCIADIYSERPERKRIFLEISVLDGFDAKTGIQRVVKNIVGHLPGVASSCEVIPVRFSRDAAGYEYSRKYSEILLSDKVIVPVRGDLFLFPELALETVITNKNLFMRMRERGVRVVSMVYDLIPVMMPDACTDVVVGAFPDFLSAVADFDGAICDSKAVADELRDWIRAKRPERSGKFRIEWFHLGGDFDRRDASFGLPGDAAAVLGEMGKRPSFLMVSTIEPRKRYDQALEAFESLWREGVDANLVIVGKAGWKVEALVRRIKRHRELGRRLFWLSGISDEYLDRVYDSAACVLMASMAEGFGLAVAEAAYHKKPVLLRDIPVFREIAGDGAFYFSGTEGGDLASAVREWMELYKRGEHPRTDSLKFLTWRESVSMLFEKLAEMRGLK